MFHHDFTQYCLDLFDLVFIIFFPNDTQPHGKFIWYATRSDSIKGAIWEIEHPTTKRSMIKQLIEVRIMALINAGRGLSNYHGLWDSQFVPKKLNYIIWMRMRLHYQMKWRPNNIDLWRKKKYSSIFTKAPTPLYVSKYSY